MAHSFIHPGPVEGTVRVNSQDHITGAELQAMKRALHLATLSPKANKNPRVGCVLLDVSGAIVAEGHHLGAGHPHAEVEALRACEQGSIPTNGLTAVVTLEPCNHQGLTGPCTKALIDAGISRVVYAASDPVTPSSGGAQALTEAGVEVAGGVMEDESELLNAHWFCAMRNARPFVTAKWAQSLDGRHAAADGTSQWITGPEARSRVHDQRAQHGAIVVGTNTAVVDNPSLTARDDDGRLRKTQPLAVAVGMRELPSTLSLREHPGGFIQITSHEPHEVLSQLFDRGVRSVYLEGGATLTSAFIREDLVDELHITVGPVIIGGPHTAVGDVGVSTLTEGKKMRIHSLERTGEDVWIVAKPMSTTREG